MADEVRNPSQRCLGLIRMTIRRNAYGRQLSSSVRHAEVSKDLLDGDESGAPLQAVLIRAPIIEEIGPSVTALASLEGLAIAVRQGFHMAATFHPELTDDTRLHRFFLRLVSRAKDERRVNHKPLPSSYCVD
jgi:5'-phosphate synthase pdxT subunit